MENISLTGLPTQQVLVYDTKIRKLGNKWQVKYRYDGEVGSFSRPSLKQAQEWCEERGLEYTVEKAK